MNRALIGVAVAVLLVIAAGYAIRGELALRLMERALEKNMLAPTIDGLADGLHVGLCGAGSPLPDAARSGPCVAVVAGERLYVVDAGSGGSKSLGLMGFPQGRIDGIFLTHFHSDHIDGLGELLMQRWVGGTHASPCPVYGPRGVEQVVAGFNAAYAQDSRYRVAHHGEATVPPGGAGGAPRPFDAPSDGQSVVVLEEAGLRVTAFRVSHPPIEPSVGYRFDYAGRSVVVSGDTVPSADLEAAGAGADVLLHEALSPTLVRVIHRAAKRTGRENVAKIMADILDYHASPVEAAESAQTIGARHLVLYHIVPPLPLAALEAVFLDGVGEAFDGDVSLGRDGLLLSLPAGSDAIEKRELL